MPHQPRTAHLAFGGALTAALLTLASTPAISAVPAGLSSPYTVQVSGRVVTATGSGAGPVTVKASVWMLNIPPATADQKLSTIANPDGTYRLDLYSLDLPSAAQVLWRVSVVDGRSTASSTFTTTASTFTAPVLQLSGPPGAPTNLTAQPGDRSANLTWNPPASDGGAAITAYAATFTAAGQTSSCTTNAATTGCQLTGLTNGVTGTVQVTATNDVGEGAAATSTLTPQAPPVAPEDPTNPDPTNPDPTNPDPTSPSNTAPVQQPSRSQRPAKRPTVRLTAGKHEPGHKITLRWIGKHVDAVRLTWQRGHQRKHSHLTSATGRITLAGPSGTTYRVTAIAGSARAHKIYRIK